MCYNSNTIRTEFRPIDCLCLQSHASVLFMNHCILKTLLDKAAELNRTSFNQVLNSQQSWWTAGQ